MKISDLIKQLEKFRDENGDVPVVTQYSGMGGYAISTCARISLTTISPLYMEDCGENGNIKDKDIIDIFPDWDGTQKSIKTMDRAKCVCIEGGTLIYAS